MNKLNLRLANIAFNVWLSNMRCAKHWKTADEIYTMTEWKKYCEERKKRPKFTPIVVPSKVKIRAEKLRDKLVEQGMSMEEAKNEVEKKYSKEGQKREDIAKLTTKIFNEKKQKSYKHTLNKRQKRQNHKETYEKHHENGTFTYGGETFKKVETYFDNQKAEEEFNKIIHVKTGQKKPKKLLTDENEDVLKNQLCQFHKGRKGNWRYRSDRALLGEFIQNMNPSAYSSLKEFKAARDRMIDLQMNNPKLGMQIVHSIFEKKKSDDEEEEIKTAPESNNEQQAYDDIMNNPNI